MAIQICNYNFGLHDEKATLDHHSTIEQWHLLCLFEEKRVFTTDGTATYCTFCKSIITL